MVDVRLPSRKSIAPAVMLTLLMMLMSASPLLTAFAPNAEASGVARHAYGFSDGSTEYVALYQGASPDTGAKVQIPVGAEVVDVSMTLSGASSTGWSSTSSTTTEDWQAGDGSGVDARSPVLTLQQATPTTEFFPHGLDTVIDPSSTAWHDNGSYAVRQPHTSNSTETRFSQQVQRTSSTLTPQGQGAVLKHHDWIFVSTWNSNNLSNVVKAHYPNNLTRAWGVTIDSTASACVLPQTHSSTYYGQYGFRDWALADDERLLAILSGYKYFYGSTAPTQYHRVLELDVSSDDEWVCTASYDISPQFGDYTGIAYDREDGTFWVAHNSQRRLVEYNMADGTWSRNSEMFSYSSSASSAWECGTTGQMVRGLEVQGNTFYMRCQKDSYYNDRDTLEAWSVSGTSTSLVPQSGIREISSLGYGLQWDGTRFVTVDSGYSTWSGKTLYYREFGTGWTYETIAAPGTTTWYGPVTTSAEDVLSVNTRVGWSAASIGDRVDHWVSADNGTHWSSVTANETIHFAHPGNELVWKAQMIGSSAVSWWVELEHDTEYTSVGSWTSPSIPTGTKVGKVRPTWVADEPAGTSITVYVSNNDGTDWYEATNGQEIGFPTEAAGSALRYSIQLDTTDVTVTPSVTSFTLEYEEGYPDRPRIDVGNDGSYDWESLLFLNESSVDASDDSIVGQDVKDTPTLVSAFNDAIPDNGDGTVDITLAVKAASPGRIKISNLDVAYVMQTRAIGASLEGGMLAPDGAHRDLVVDVARGDDVTRVNRVDVTLQNSHGEDPTVQWSRGDQCSVISDGGGVVHFDAGNCTSTSVSDSITRIRIPTLVDWSWNDEVAMEANITVVDPIGEKVTDWTTTGLDVRIENDIQLDGLRVFDETGRELYPLDWVRGGYNLSFAGKIHFEGSQLNPLGGEFDLRVLGQNVTYDGDPIGEPVVLATTSNPSFGEYNITFQSPLESAPGGMVFHVEAVDMVNGSVFTNPGYNTIRLTLDGNSPLVLSSDPMDGVELHAATAQPISLVIQDSVDPPSQISLHYWLGCKASQAIGCTDYNFDGLPQAEEYELKTVSSPEVRAGGLNIFETSIDDSMLVHGQRVSFFISGKDAQDNVVAMGGGPVCPEDLGSSLCGTRPGEVPPDWSADLVTYTVREEFQPELDAANSTIVGHDDEAPLHPGVPYTAQISLSDGNGWDDIQQVQFALGGDFDDDDTSIFITLAPGEDGLPVAHMTTGGEYLAVSNLYSNVQLDAEDPNSLVISALFQLTWSFPESFDTDGETFVRPKVRVTDQPCGLEPDVPCFEVEASLGNNWWSLDNDFRFDTEQGHIRAVELRDGTNHYSEDFDETIIGAGQALRVTGRVLFSEDETPAPAGAFDVTFGDYDHVWVTSPRADGEFSLDLLVPSIRSGYLDLKLGLDDLPGLAEDQTDIVPRVQFIVDSSSPTLAAVTLSRIEAGDALPIGQANDLLVQLETLDDHGFDAGESAVLHYRVRAGEAEISRGALELPDTTPFGEQFFWSGNLDLTDAGATTLLPTYMVDVWVSGSDAAGNPFDTTSNTVVTPFATWPLALIGPSIDLEATSAMWDDPSPAPKSAAVLDIQATNEGGSGEIAFVLQRRQDAGFWAEIAREDLTASAASDVQVQLSVMADGEVGDRLEHRLLLLVDGVEADRVPLAPLLLTEEVARDGDALREDIGEQRFSLFLYVITMLSLSAAVWMLVVYRRMAYGDDSVASEDQTKAVMAEMSEAPKALPELADLPPPPGLNIESSTPVPPGLNMPAPASVVEATPPAPTYTTDDPRGLPPKPPTGLPAGWTEEQWAHYGWSYLDAQ